MRPALLGLLVCALALASTPPPAGAAAQPGGAFTCDFAVSMNDIPLDEFPGLIERDRMYMAERPGMLHKHIPLRPGTEPGSILSGGRYLFDTEPHAQEYIRWVGEDFVLDGVHFFEREPFSDIDCHAWAAIGSAQLGDIRDQQVTIRTERWSVPADNQRPFLKAQWPVIEDEARARGLSAVWLLYQRQESLATIVAFGPPLAGSPDAGLVALEAAPTLAPPAFALRGYEKTFDRTHWTLTVWFPYGFADSGEPSAWPNSPPLPEPGPRDSVCEPSRGETHATAPDDCTPRCGDGVPDEDETTRSCPSDVRLG